MDLKPLHPSIGAQIDNIDLRTIDDHSIKPIRQALLQHKVLFFPNQSLSPAEHTGFAKLFGPLEPPHPFFPHVDDHPEVSVLEVYPGHPPGETFWHTDTTWYQAPSMGSVLYSRIIPPTGGDTIWLCMEKVWEELDQTLQKTIAPLWGIHATHAFRGSRFDSSTEDGHSRVESIEQQLPPVAHPLISRHPETGRVALYLNEQYTRGIQGWSVAESQALLSDLFERARTSSHQVRYQWQPNTVAIWDNRCTQHYAVTDYGDQHRTMHRVTIAGQPILPAFIEN